MNEPRSLTRDQSRRIDALATEQLGVSTLVLMENAGRGVVDALLEFDPRLAGHPPATPVGGQGVAGRSPAGGPASPRVAILCGKGNNAGDGFVIARHLAIRGVPAATLCLSPPSGLAGDARENYDAAVACDLQLYDLSKAGSSDPPLQEQLDAQALGCDWLVDAMLGTGAQGEPREPFAAAIRWMNAQAARRLAVDLPSGLDSDSGLPATATVRADLTCTFVAPKTGFANPAAAPWLGVVRVVAIGLPPDVAAALAAG